VRLRSLAWLRGWPGAACPPPTSGVPGVGTANAARDMDVLRAALGDAKLTYLGKSYGTYLGSWYAQLFPGHVRALVLDGAVNPREPALSMNLAQARGFQVALRSFIADCLRRSACPFPGGESVTAAIARVQAMLDQAARKPLRSQIAGQPGDSALLLNGLAGSLYSTSFWPYLREGLKAALARPGTRQPRSVGPRRWPGSQVRGAARLERRRAHRVHAGQFVRGLRRGQVPDQPGGPAQRHRVPVAGEGLPRQAGRTRAGPPGR
jgi:pimeloyl-ACP methyl ester carboxylesterase